MESLGERRRLNPAVVELGIAGLALLRLQALRDPDRASECVDEIRRILADVDEAGPIEVRTPFLDVASGYTRWAEIYDAPGNQLIECEEPVIHPLLDELDGDPLLDAACGTGRHLAYLASRGHRMIAVDVVPAMIDKAREKTPDADYRIGDLTALPVEDGEVRGAVCSLALEHVADVRAAYRELARVVAPGGTVVTSTMHPVLRSIFGWGAWFVDEHGKTDIPTFDRAFADYINAATDAGLILRCCEEPIAPDSALPSDASMTVRIAYSAAPMVLILQFARP
jgi:ubiquinone/menaquinone biosynthesis C-methylase UbiE